MAPTQLPAAAPRALVTGAAGFLGSHVVDSCLDLGMEVVAVDDLSGGFVENVPDGAEWREGDLRDPGFVEALWDDGRFDYVYHLGAYAAEGLSHFIRRYNYETNLVASVNLVNQAILHEADCFVFTSSIAVYGAGQLPMTEDLVPQPEDPYGVSKYAVELDLAAADRMFGLDHVIFRPHNVYGERQNIADKYRNVIGIFMNALLNGQPMPVFGDGLQTRAFSHVADVAPIIARSPLVQAARNRTFNVGADRPYTILELAEEVARALDLPCELEHLPPREEVVHAYADHGKVRDAFQPSEAIDLRTGIERMARWVRERGPQSPVEFSEIEVEKNLPPSWRVRQPLGGEA
ncbi:MAG: NAD-dependent epimerase/dehydratase family protein [Solirubrobacteraceae bacterium]